MSNKVVVIYDETGLVNSIRYDLEEAIPVHAVAVPLEDSQYVASMDTSVDPHVPVIKTVEKTSLELQAEQIQQMQAELRYLRMISKGGL